MTSTQPKTVGDIVDHLSERAPLETAENWDNVGLLVGDRSVLVKKVVVCVDLTPEAVEKAKSLGANLILNHHPCIFPKSNGIASVCSDSLIYQCASEGISVAAYHTNFDQCALEVIDSISKGLQVKVLGRLVDSSSSSGQLMKLAVMVPKSHVEEVQQALFEAGAGHIGNYDSCSFLTSGTGSFRGGDLSQPFLGKPGELEVVSEVKLETVLPCGLSSRVLKALKKSHPYEEVAFDLYSLEQKVHSSGLLSGFGYGFWGDFPESRHFSEVSKDVNSLFGINGFWITNPTPTRVKRIGFVAGKGSSFMSAAMKVGCDLFVTGEAGYHQALSGSRRGMAVMELGHRESERFFLMTIKKWMSEIGIESEMIATPTQQIWLGGMK